MNYHECYNDLTIGKFFVFRSGYKKNIVCKVVDRFKPNDCETCPWDCIIYSYGNGVERRLFTNEFHNIVSFDTADEAIAFVNDNMPKKESFVITSVSRSDLEGIGFDTSKVSDAQMERLAEKMAEDYVNQMFWISLEILAEDLGFPKTAESGESEV